MLLMLAIPSTASAQRLDQSFDGDGWLSAGFQAVAGMDFDIGLAACADGQGRLLVAGLASGGRRVVTMRLLENGSFDPDFSGDGKESFDLLEPVAALSNASTPAVCTSDGRPVISYPTLRSDGEMEVVVLRIGATGLPDNSFGNQGRTRIKFWETATLEQPTAFAVSHEGLELAAEVQATNLGARVGVARLEMGGAIRIKGVLATNSFAAITAIGLPENSLDLVIAGAREQGLGPQATRPLMLSKVNKLNLGIGPVDSLGGFELAQIGRGRLLADGRMGVAVGRLRGPHVRPGVALIDSSNLATVVVDFDRSVLIEGAESSVDVDPMGMEVVPLQDGRVAVMAGLRRSGVTGQRRGLFVGLIRDQTIDTSVGQGGGWVLPVTAPICAGQGTPDFRFRRSTLWNGRLTFVGGVRAAPCGLDSLNYDYWVARMSALPAPPMFADGFE
jgi:hypothetical protein